ncbi:MAG: hypothetical protein ACOH2J_09240 [Allorhizobium sp.]
MSAGDSDQGVSRPMHASRMFRSLLVAWPIWLISTAAAHAHGAERGLVMLLPTGYSLVGGALAVAATFLALAIIPNAWFRRVEGARLDLVPAVSVSRPGVSLFSCVVLLVLVVAGFMATADPLTNPLPLVVWTFWWVGFTLAQAVFGNLWAWFNPWTGLSALLRFLTATQIGIRPLARISAGRGYWPAIGLFLLFAWYELVSLSPEDPPQLAMTVAAYWAFTLAMMALFGEKAWAERCEPFSVFFRMVGMLAPVVVATGDDGRARIMLSWPGQRCLDVAPLPFSGIIFILLTLGSASFDGFSETFTWLGFIGVNPLEFPGRSAVTLANTLGLVAAPVILSLLFFAAVGLGSVLAGERSVRRIVEIAGHLVYSIIPISIAFHGAHYLTMMLVNGQYLWAVLSDPFALGWNLFGTADWHVTASFMSNLDSVRYIWAAQTAIIVGGHIVGIMLAHVIALRYFPTPLKAAISQSCLAAVMVFYTVFGLWLLSTPTIG